VETRLVIARTKPFAADGVGATRLGFQGQAVRHLWETRSLQLGQPKFGAREKEIGS
jgi:hypothetical protein